MAYDLPGTVLVLGVTVVSVVFAARAFHAGASGARGGVWLSAAGLFLMVMMAGTGMANAVVQPHSPALHWVVRAVAAASGAAAAILARRPAGDSSPAPR